MRSTALSLSSLILSSASTGLPMNHSSVFFQFNYFTLHICNFYLVLSYIFYLFVEVHTVFIFMTITLNSVRLIPYLTFIKVFFLKSYLVLSFGTYSSASSFCLTLCVGFSALAKTVTLPSLEELALCSRWTLSLISALVLVVSQTFVISQAA